MAPPRKNADISAIREALSINGEPKIAIDKFVELVQQIENLTEGQHIVRARSLTMEHVGQEITLPNGRTGRLDDVEEWLSSQRPVRQREAYEMNRYVVDEVDDAEFSERYDVAPAVPAARGSWRKVTVVINAKIVKLPANLICVLSG